MSLSNHRNDDELLSYNFPFHRLAIRFEERGIYGINKLIEVVELIFFSFTLSRTSDDAVGFKFLSGDVFGLV